MCFPGDFWGDLFFFSDLFFGDFLFLALLKNLLGTICYFGGLLKQIHERQHNVCHFGQKTHRPNYRFY